MLSPLSSHRAKSHRVSGVSTGPRDAREFSQAHGKSRAGAVLVVDDEPLIRWSLVQTLGDRGLAVTEAGDGQSAMREVASAPEPFAVIVLDYRLPDSQDFTLLAWLRRESPSSSIILITAHGGAPEVSRGALDLGAIRVVTKPFELDDIADLVIQASALR